MAIQQSVVLGHEFIQRVSVVPAKISGIMLFTIVSKVDQERLEKCEAFTKYQNGQTQLEMFLYRDDIKVDAINMVAIDGEYIVHFLRNKKGTFIGLMIPADYAKVSKFASKKSLPVDKIEHDIDY